MAGAPRLGVAQAAPLAFANAAIGCVAKFAGVAFVVRVPVRAAVRVVADDDDRPAYLRSLLRWRPLNDWAVGIRLASNRTR